MRCASRCHLSISAAVYPSPSSRRSTFSLGSPFSRTAHTRPAVGAGARSTRGEAGSTGTDQTSLKGPAAARSSRATLTGPAGRGKRTDSWKARVSAFASGVACHSPKTLAKPRE